MVKCNLFKHARSYIFHRNKGNQSKSNILVHRGGDGKLKRSYNIKDLAQVLWTILLDKGSEFLQKLYFQGYLFGPGPKNLQMEVVTSGTRSAASALQSMGHFLSEKHFYKADQDYLFVCLVCFFINFGCAQYSLCIAKATVVTGCSQFPALGMEALWAFTLQTFGAEFGANKLYKSCAEVLAAGVGCAHSDTIQRSREQSFKASKQITPGTIFAVSKLPFDTEFSYTGNIFGNISFFI